MAVAFFFLNSSFSCYFLVFAIYSVLRTSFGSARPQSSKVQCVGHDLSKPVPQSGLEASVCIMCVDVVVFYL